MIFVTVGTHEQGFDRLIRMVDKLKGDNIIKEDVIIQRGYTKFVPKFCKYYDIIPYFEMEKYFEDAHIIITHGGPASFINAIKIGKTPIVVPRLMEFNEHVNDHQFKFCCDLEERGFNIILIKSIDELEYAICNYDLIIKKEKPFLSNNLIFNEKLLKLIRELF